MKIKLFSVIAAIILTQFPAFCVDSPESLQYEIIAVLDMAKHELSAWANITIPVYALAAPNEVHLKAKSAGLDIEDKPLLKIKRITSKAGSELIQTIDKTGDTITVYLPEPVKDDRSVSIHVDYSISLLDDAASWKKDFGYFLFPGDEDDDLWYPDVSVPGGKSLRFRNFKVGLTYPDGVAILTSGTSKGKPERRGKKLYAEFAAQHVEAFALNIGGGYVINEVAGDNFQVVTFTPPGLVETFLQAAKGTADAVDWYRRKYGFFPVSQIGLASGHKSWSGGFPASNIFYLHRGTLKPEFLRWITSHELGHYYWGLYILSATGCRLDWLMLANGIWIDQLYIAQAKNRTLEEQWRSLGSGNWFVDYLTARLANYDQRLGITGEEERKLDFSYNSLVRHGKAAVGLYLQTRRLGFDRFLELQRKLLAQYKYRELSVEEFVKHFEKAGCRGASRFFEQWQRGDATIGFNVTSIETEQRKDSFHYRIIVKRTGTVQYPVVLEVKDAGGKTVGHELAGEAKQEEVTGILTASLSEVRLDPDGVLPMWNSAHPEIQRCYLIALDNAGLTRPFLILAQQYLSLNPGDEVIKRRISKRSVKRRK